MKKKPATLPRGYRTCTASLAVADVPAALQFYESAFDAKVQHFDAEDAPGFAAIKIGNSMLFVTAGWGAHVPTAPGATAPVGHHMYVDDVDAVLEAAVEQGATLLNAAEDTYWGERCATIADPFGHFWTLATRIENLKSEDISERRKALIQAVPDREDVQDPELEVETEAA